MKYGPEKTKEICGYIDGGLGRVDACIMADVSYETFTVWMNNSEFSDAIKKAEVGNKKFHIEIIKKAADKTWQAAAWWLERKWKDEFAQRNEWTGKEGKELKLYSDEQKQKIAKRVLRGAVGQPDNSASA
jgi:hypothetical protein